MMKDLLDETPLVLLRCNSTVAPSDEAVTIVEGMLKSVIRDFGEIMDDGVAGCYMEESYASRAYELLEERGCPDDLEDAVEAAALDAEALLSELMAENHDILQTFSNNWLVDEVAVLQRTPKLWVVRVFGSRFPF